MTRLEYLLRELVAAHDEWRVGVVGGTRLHRAVAAIRDASKTSLAPLAPGPLWVYPHEATFSGDLVHASMVDEMGLEFDPSGMTVEEIRREFARTYETVVNEPLAPEAADRITGAWVVPHHVWSLIGSAYEVSPADPGQATLLNEVVTRVVASQALFHIGEEPSA